jgi:hypothetical protein
VFNREAGINKKFWEELFACFTFTAIWIFDTNRKKILWYMCVRNVVNKTVQFDRLQCWYYWWDGLTEYAVEMASVGMIYVLSFTLIGSAIITEIVCEAAVLVLPILWIYVLCRWGGLVYIPSFIKTGSGVQIFLRGYTTRHTARWAHEPTHFLRSKKSILKIVTQ